MSKTILITGTSTGFGHLTARRLASQGHTVFASMRAPSGKNLEHAKALENKGIHVIELDVTNNESITRAVTHIQEQAGRLDVLVNNAGCAAAGISEAFTDAQVTKMFDVNVIGVQRVTRAVLPMMRQQGSGLIINVGSILGRITFPFFGLYGASKFALEALSESYRYELSQLGIDVVLAQPSAFPTSMYASAQQPSDTSRIDDYGEIADIPSAMLGNFMELFESENAPTPEDVAGGIANLVEQAPNERPARLVIGASFGADAVNEATGPIQQRTIDALGLNRLSCRN